MPSQFTSVAFTGLLQDQAIAISMGGRSGWRDNVFVKPLWRSVKYEEPTAFEPGRENARAGLPRPSAAEAGSIRKPPLPWPRSGRTTPSPRDTTKSPKRAYQPA